MTCLHCGGELPPPKPKGRPRLFCSLECKAAARTSARREKTAAALVGRRCKMCNELIPSSRLASARTCSLACNIRLNNQRGAAKKAQKSADARAARPPCPICAEPLPLSRRRGAKYCSDKCQAVAAARAWRERGSDYMRQYLYGVTPEQYQALLDAQDDRCAVCRSDAWPGKDNRPHVDHDHATGAVRGLLCGRCNTGLGQFQDDPALLRAAVDYLTH